jgi:hypothetical protein
VPHARGIAERNRATPQIAHAGESSILFAFCSPARRAGNVSRTAPDLGSRNSLIAVTATSASPTVQQSRNISRKHACRSTTYARARRACEHCKMSGPQRRGRN